MGETLFWLAAAIVGGLWLLRHLSMFNRRTCPKCQGQGELRSGLFKTRTRGCPRCGGRRQIRGIGGRPE